MFGTYFAGGVFGQYGVMGNAPPPIEPLPYLRFSEELLFAPMAASSDALGAPIGVGDTLGPGVMCGDDRLEPA